MSGGGNQQTSTQTTGAPAWMQPYQQGYLQQASQVAKTPYTPSPTQVTAPNQWQTAGYQALANRATQGSPTMSAANTQLTNTINGGYLNANPYLDSMVNKAQGDVIRNYNDVAKPATEASMVNSGSFGNSGLQQYQQNQQRDLQETLANISTQLRGNNYTTERANQMSAISQAPAFAQSDYNDAGQLINAGNLAQGNANAQNAQNLQWWNEAQAYPQKQLDSIGTALQRILGGNSTTTQTTPGTSTAASIAGGALTGAQIWNLLQGG